MLTIKQACVPRPSDPLRRSTVLDLTDLAQELIDPVEFFAENYVTKGGQTLLTEGFRRLEGKTTQGVFKLTQAMGGGRTHNLLELGLMGVLRYLATMEIDHWQTDARAACLVAGAVENGHV